MEKTHPSKGRKAIMEQELLRGRETANQLHEVLVHKSKSNKEEESIILQVAQDLVHQVLRSFTNSLLLLNTDSAVSVSDEVVGPIKIEGLSSSPATCFETTENNPIIVRNNKRKSMETNWEKDSPILTEDGHAWRKYGQKKTKNSKYLRNYYRCTHKLDQGCPAIKQVQRIQENPPLYRTTYIGHHNCKSSYFDDNNEIIVEPDDDSFPASSIVLSFNCNIPNNEKPSSSSPIFESIKQEVLQPDHIAHDQYFSSSSPEDCLLLSDYEIDDFNYYSSHIDAMLSSTHDAVQFDNVFGGSLDFDGLERFLQQN